VTVVGLLPLMFQLHPNFHGLHLEYKAPGSEWWVQLSSAVVWGLSFATLLTLILTPVMLAAPKVYSQRFGKLAGRLGLRKRSDRGRLGDQGPEIPKAAE